MCRFFALAEGMTFFFLSVGKHSVDYSITHHLLQHVGPRRFESFDIHLGTTGTYIHLLFGIWNARCWTSTLEATPVCFLPLLDVNEAQVHFT
jgi:hypothetical protein